MPPNDDMPALESWLREKALEAHNKAEKYSGRVADYPMQRYYLGKEEMANATIAKIQSGRANQRPHVIFTED